MAINVGFIVYFYFKTSLTPLILNFIGNFGPCGFKITETTIYDATL